MIEIQIVPSDIRRTVRYVFFDRRRVLIGIVALSALLSVVIGSMAAAPTVIRRVYRDSYAKSMREERDIQRERLRENVTQMTSLERSLEEHRVRVERLLHPVAQRQRRGRAAARRCAPSRDRPALRHESPAAGARSPG